MKKEWDKIHFLNNNMKSAASIWLYMDNNKIISLRTTGQSSYTFVSFINITLVATKALE